MQLISEEPGPLSNNRLAAGIQQRGQLLQLFIRPGETMRRSLFLFAAAIFLVSACTSLPAQPASRSQPATVDPSTHTIEGCVSSIDDAFVLTLSNGHRYELTGDTPLLADRVGQTVRLWGHVDSATDAEMMVAGQPHFAFGVDKVETLSAGCKIERLHRG